MFNYVDNVISEFAKEVGKKTYQTPAAAHLFKVREDEDRKLLSEEQTVQFHHTTAQLLFLYARARRDIQTSVVFLTMRVKEPDKDDWGTLK